MQTQKSRLAIIHVAKKQLGLDDETYYAILSGAGVASARDIETETQFNTVMTAFMILGFLPGGKGAAVKNRRCAAGVHPSMISRRQEYYIRGLWALASRARDEKSLRRIVKRIGKTDDIAFLSRRAASAVILALRDICWKAGFNPDAKEEYHALDCKTGGAAPAPQTAPGVLPPGDGRNRSRQNRQRLAARARRGEGI
jgi:hypothetical protein